MTGVHANALKDRNKAFYNGNIEPSHRVADELDILAAETYLLEPIKGTQLANLCNSFFEYYQMPWKLAAC